MSRYTLEFSYETGYGTFIECCATVILDGDHATIEELTTPNELTAYGDACVSELAIELAWKLHERNVV